MGFTAYAQLRLPQVAEAFTHLGFPAYFRVELSWAKLLGVVLLLAPVPARLKEWAYAGFAITSAPRSSPTSRWATAEAWGWAAGTGVLWGLSYFFWRRLQATPAAHSDGASATGYVGMAVYPRAQGHEEESTKAEGKAASKLISDRIAELGDWRGEDAGTDARPHQGGRP